MRPIVVMGVSGVGKTTVGMLIAEGLGADFVDADDLHGPANLAKMSAGIPLVDEDRWPWLDRVGATLTAGTPVVIACSALKRAYRDRLRDAAPTVLFVHLVADVERLTRQTTERDGHFMPPGLLRSQIDTLEPLTADEGGIEVRVDADPAAIAERTVHLIAPDGADE